MINKVNKWKNPLTIIFLILSLKLSAQNKLEISSGLGFKELVNMGFYYNINDNFQTGIKIGSGSFPFLGISATGCLNLFHSGNSLYTLQKPFYFNSGINYSRSESERLIMNFLSLHFGHGKVFNFSKRFGLKLELGFGIQLLYKRKEKNMNESGFFPTYYPSYEDVNLLMPNIGIDFIYRFKMN